MDYIRDTQTPRIHPTQKSKFLIKTLIELFTDKWEVVTDMCAGSWITLKWAYELDREAYWFEIKKDFVKLSNKEILKNYQKSIF